MLANKLELRTLRPEDETSFLNAIASFKDEVPPFQFALDFDQELPFSTYLEKLENWSLGKDLPARFVPSSFLVAVVDGQIVGRVSIRHELNDFLARIGGHVGYGVIPSCRKRGYASEMLQQALTICSGLGLEKILVTCDEDNLGSARVIERCGGILEGITDEPELKVQVRRYWINLS